MRLFNQTHLILFAFLFIIGACRNAPEVPPIPKDTEVNVRISNDPAGLNFLLHYDAGAILAMSLLSLPLGDFNPTTYELEPILVKSLPIIEEVSDGKYKGLISYQYEMLEEAVWDDGTPITGKDVLFPLKAMYNPNYRSPYPSYFSFVEEVVINPDNPKQFTVYAKRYLIAKAVIGNFTPMPAHVLDPNGVYDSYTLADLRNPKNKEKLAADESLKAAATLFTSPKNMGQEGAMVGSGAYKLKSWTTGQALVFEKKENWWGDQVKRDFLAAHPKTITLKIVPDFNAARSLLANGQLDIMGNIGIGDFESLKKNDYIKENFNFYDPSRLAYRTIIMNTTNPKLSDKKVRRALAHLLELEEVFDVVYMGEKKYITTPIHPSKSYYNKNLKQIPFNIEKAKTLLQTAGWTDSNNNGIVDKTINGQLQELDLRLIFSAKSKDYNTIAQIFQEDAKKAGINIELAPSDGRSILSSWKQKKYDLSFRPETTYPFHKDLRQNWHSGSPSNYSGFGTVASDQILDEIAQTVDEEKLAELYTKFQEIVYEEQPVIMINTASHHIIANKKFGNIPISAIASGYYLKRLNEVTVPITSSNN